VKEEEEEETASCRDHQKNLNTNETLGNQDWLQAKSIFIAMVLSLKGIYNVFNTEKTYFYC